MESAWFLANNSLASFSEQMCVDCVNGGADTCQIGGEMHDCYLQVIKQGGDVSEANYPYTASDGKCHWTKSEALGKFSTYKNVTVDDETALKVAASQTVISVGIDASSIWFQLYSSGVYNDSSCSNSMFAS